MARLPRYAVPGIPQHVIQRGNNRQAIFADTTDYQAYIAWLKEASQRYGLRIHAYVLMTNHVHLLTTPDTEDSIGKTLQSLGRRYVQYFNHSYDRTGTLWEGRYRATVIETERYFLACSRYIELNPVRAGMVSIPGDYRWSSYHHNAQGQSDELVTSHELYQRLGPNQLRRCENYRGLFGVTLDPSIIQAIRDATNRAWALGNAEFQNEIQSITQRRTTPLPRGRRKRQLFDGESVSKPKT